MPIISSFCPSLDSFNFYLKQFGISSSNIFDVKIDIADDIGLYKELKKLGNFNHKNYNPLESISFYTDQVSLPGEQVSTSAYKFNSSPAYKYATDVVYPEVTITLLLDSFMNQKKIFENWINYIKPMSVPLGGTQLLRTRYKDDYVSDIRIVKYERYNYGNTEGGIFTPKQFPYMKNEDGSIRAYAPAPVYRYSTVLKNAFPTTISSVELSSGSAQLNRVSVTFNYDYPIFSSTETLRSVDDTLGSIENPRKPE
jgi:hypothetical protein